MVGEGHCWPGSCDHDIEPNLVESSRSWELVIAWAHEEIWRLAERLLTETPIWPLS